jgi:hypothetical protein
VDRGAPALEGQRVEGLREATRSFAEGEIRPLAEELDASERYPAIF